MNNANFKILDRSSNLKDTNYVIISAGKGKEDNSKIYIEYYAFSFLEGLIWDKYREYNNRKKIKITSLDIKRILDGIIIAANGLGKVDEKEIKDILKFDLYSPKYPLSDLIENLDYFKDFIIKFTNCILDFAEKEKYIIINRENIESF